MFATENGTIKKTELQAFRHPRVGGIIAINIDDEDRLLGVRLTDGESDILLATAGGYCIRFPEGDEETEDGKKLIGVRAMGRVARGVRGIDLRPGDRVVSMEALDREGDLLTIAAGGYGKRTALLRPDGKEEYRRQSRGGKGIINLKTTDKTGEVVAVKQVRPGDGMVLITQSGKLIRSSVDGVSRIGRATQGVKVMDLGADDRVVAVAKIVDRDDDDGDEPSDGNGSDRGSGPEGGEPADGGDAMLDETTLDPRTEEPVN